MRMLTLVSLAALVAAAAPAAAQSLPPGAPGVGLADTRALVSALAGPDREWRRPLGGTADALLFSGEAAGRTLPVYVAPGEASRPARLELATLSAISASPDASRIAVTVNGTLLGERAIRGFDAPETLGFDIAPGMLQPGFNAVRVDVRHTHRVDCSLEATYELWTRVLPEASGLVFDASPSRVLDLRALAAVPAGPDGLTEIRLRTGPDRSPEALERLARAAQAVVIAGRYAEPVVVAGEGRAEGPGIDLVVATRDRLGPLGLAAPAAPGPSAALVDDPRTGRLTLVVTGASPEEVDDALTLFERSASALAPIGTPDGLRALDASARRLVGGETLSLPEIGLDPRPFAGRFFRAEATVLLPGDFYAADYDRMTLSVDAAYAAGLAPGAELAVRVNGAVVASVPLANPRGDVLRDREVHLPLGAFKPGTNRIAFEARTPARSDEACLPETIARGQDRFVLSPTTTLRAPRLARIGSLPEISGVASGSLALVSGGEPLDLAIPGGEEDAVAAAMTLLAQSAGASGRLTPVRIGFATPRPGDGHLIVVGAIDRIGDDILAAADLPASEMRRAWAGESAPAVSEAEPEPARLARPVRVASAGTAVLIDLDAIAQEPEAPALAEPQPVEGLAPVVDGFDLAWLGEAAEAGIERVLQVAALDLPELGLVRPTPEPLAVDAGATLVVGQGAVRAGFSGDAFRSAAFDIAALDASGDRGTGLLPEASSVTVITAPTAALLREGVAGLLTTGAAQQLVGQSALYRPAEGAVASRVVPADVLVETQPFGVGNARLVLAGWLSRNTGLYLFALAAIGFALAVVGYATVRLSGVRN